MPFSFLARFLHVFATWHFFCFFINYYFAFENICFDQRLFCCFMAPNCPFPFIFDGIFIPRIFLCPFRVLWGCSFLSPINKFLTCKLRGWNMELMKLCTDVYAYAVYTVALHVWGVYILFNFKFWIMAWSWFIDPGILLFSTYIWGSS